MKPIAILTLFLSLVLASCSGKETQKAEGAKPFHDKAFALYRAGAPAEEYIAMQEKAIEELHEGRCSYDPVLVLSQMGHFYLHNGKYSDGLDYLHEATEYRIAHNDTATYGDITLFGTLSTLYARYKMFDEARRMNWEAIEIARKLNHPRLVDLYRMRAAMYPDSVANDTIFKYLDLARKAIDGISGETPAHKDESMRDVECERVIWMIENYEKCPDSLASAIQRLEHLMKFYNKRSHLTEPFILGMGYFLNGQHSKGIPLMENAMNVFEQKKMTENIIWSYETIMKLYAKEKMYDRMAALYPRFYELNDSIEAEKNLEAAIAADIRFRASKKEQENRLLDMELTVARQRIIILTILIVLGVALTVWLICFGIRRSRINQLKRLELDKKISELTHTHRQLNSRIESLVDEINTNKTENAAMLLSPSLLKTDKEGKFRRLFEALHPDFLLRLKEKSSKLTPNDQLVCMLIYMKQSNEEIALCLGITRMSVNTARYRIRTRLGLPKDVDLDEFIASICD